MYRKKHYSDSDTNLSYLSFNFTPEGRSVPWPRIVLAVRPRIHTCPSSAEKANTCWGTGGEIHHLNGSVAWGSVHHLPIYGCWSPTSCWQFPWKNIEVLESDRNQQVSQTWDIQELSGTWDLMSICKTELMRQRFDLEPEHTRTFLQCSCKRQ